MKKNNKTTIEFQTSITEIWTKIKQEKQSIYDLGISSKDELLSSIFQTSISIRTFPTTRRIST